MADALRATRVWWEALALPETLATTTDAAGGFDEVVQLLSREEVRRIVATGNGAAFYVAHALWLASLGGRPARAAVVAVPAGLLARGRFEWRPGDRLLVVSSSGELRDAIEAINAGAPAPYAVVTSNPESTIARGAGARALVHVASQEALTHTQAFCGNVAAALSVWVRLTGDRELGEALRGAPARLERGLAEAETWADEVAGHAGTPSAAIVFGSGPAWAAALEAALLLKEVARVPTEGSETREGATSGMYALAPGQLAVSLPTGPDELLVEAEATCAGTGATVLRAPGGASADARLSAIATFPAALALATAIGLRRGLDVDKPGWADAYYATTRVKPAGGRDEP